MLQESRKTIKMFISDIITEFFDSTVQDVVVQCRTTFKKLNEHVHQENERAESSNKNVLSEQ